MTVPVAFFAPEAAPTAQRLSGPRQLARLVVVALRQAGFEPKLASRFAPGSDLDGARGERLRALGGRLAARTARRIAALDAEARPRALVSLRIHGGAPELVAPGVAARTGLPLVALRAGADGTENADEDEVALRPFIDTARYGMEIPDAMRGPFRAMVGAGAGLDPEVPWIAVAAMMHDARKVESFRMLAAALARIADRPWQLVIAGDGPRRASVAQALFALGPARVRLMGTMRGGDLAALFRAADLYAWPALGEPLALSCLEAQAAGLPVVACAGTGAGTGVAGFVREAETGYLVTAGDAAAFADATRRLLEAPGLRASMGQAARAHARARHGMERAVETLRARLAAAVSAPGPW